MGARGHRGGFAGDGFVQPVNDVAVRVVIRNQRDDLRFGENRTHAGYGQLLVPRQAAAAHFRHVQFQCARHHLQKTPRSGGAFVVHHEARDVAGFIQIDDFAVLPANVDDRADGGIQKMRATRVAG